MSVDELVEGYDRRAAHTATSLDYFMEELRHREIRGLLESLKEGCKPSWVVEYAKCVGFAMFSELAEIVKKDLLEFNALPDDLRYGYKLRAEDYQREGRNLIHVLREDRSQGDPPRVSVLVAILGSSEGVVTVGQVGGNERLTVEARWDESRGKAYFKAGDFSYETLADVSRMILMPPLFYPHLNRIDARREIRAHTPKTTA